jgi:hypothetical protein
MAGYPIRLTAHANWEYFEKREGLNPGMLFKNPMMLIMVVSMGFMFLMPKLKDSMDPETLKELERIQGGGTSTQSKKKAAPKVKG